METGRRSSTRAASKLSACSPWRGRVLYFVLVVGGLVGSQLCQKYVYVRDVNPTLMR